MVPAKRSRQNHAQHVLAVAKVGLEQERSPAAMNNQKNLTHHTPMVELKTPNKKTTKRQ
jgi:hypothetical protein